MQRLIEEARLGGQLTSDAALEKADPGIALLGLVSQACYRPPEEGVRSPLPVDVRELVLEAAGEVWRHPALRLTAHRVAPPPEAWWELAHIVERVTGATCFPLDVKLKLMTLSTLVCVPGVLDSFGPALEAAARRAMERAAAPA
jgi:hypothetical protein